VKIVQAGENFVCQLAKREKNLLVELLKLYPCIPCARPGKKRTGGAPEASQRLLDEALAEQRTVNRLQVQNWLSDPDRFQQMESAWRFILSGSEMEWLLQILNDIRVGSWLSLGAPDEKLEFGVLNEKTAPHFWAMQVAGEYEMRLLKALESQC